MVNFDRLEQRIRSLVVQSIRSEGLRAAGESPRLILAATLHEPGMDLGYEVIAASVRLDLREPVRLMRDPKVIMTADGGAVTWSKVFVIVDRPDQIEAAIEREARALTTMFAQDARAANNGNGSPVASIPVTGRPRP